MENIDSSLTLKLSDGYSVPKIGVGVYKVEPSKSAELIEKSILAGARLIDTASFYENEGGVGDGIRSAGIPRKEIFVTTKLWLHELGYENTLKAFEQSLKKLALDYLDLYLIHWPAPKRGPVYLDSWRAMEKLKAEGLVNSIGVSNFHSHHLQNILESCRFPPALNQVEIHPWLTQENLVKFHLISKIVTQSSSPLARGQILSEQSLIDIANQLGKKVSQVILRWHIQRGLSVIPKSSDPDRIKENLNIFDFQLSNQQMAHISGLNKNFRTGLDPEDRN
ncbi:MAG: aldo/keto reductase [Candidatus Nanopelagicaceae bacterium]